MHDPITLDAFANAKLEPVTSIKEDFKRYEIKFPDGEIPEELKIAAQNTDKAKEIGAVFVPIPDKDILSHLKVYDEDMADISLCVTFPDKGALYSLEVSLHPTEKHLFDNEIQRADKTRTSPGRTKE